MAESRVRVLSHVILQSSEPLALRGVPTNAGVRGLYRCFSL